MHRIDPFRANQWSAVATTTLDKTREFYPTTLHGNCSSATVRLVLDEIRRRRDRHDGDRLIFMAFGPGLTLYAALLRARRPGTPRSG